MNKAETLYWAHNKSVSCTRAILDLIHNQSANANLIGYPEIVLNNIAELTKLGLDVSSIYEKLPNMILEDNEDQINTYKLEEI